MRNSKVGIKRAVFFKVTGLFGNQIDRARRIFDGIDVIGCELQVSYMDEIYPVEVYGIGYKPVYDSENLKPRS
ncbi:MAG: hypothetical protein ACFHHU_16270 [Porticoccaceae bacterium]|uniref:hypothetical protein n=1 Tax=Thalassospira sp. TaxID=1912094 RepID=UPI003A8A1B57